MAYWVHFVRARRLTLAHVHLVDVHSLHLGQVLLKKYQELAAARRAREIMNLYETMDVVSSSR